MGAITSANLVNELQRRLTNLSDDTALAALNRACRWIARQASFQFLSAAKTTLTVNTTVAATQTFTGTISMLNGDPSGLYVSGSAFDTTGLWSIWTGPVTAMVPTGHDGLTITIGTKTYTVAWTGTFAGWGGVGSYLQILGDFDQPTGSYTWTLTITSTSNSNGPSDLDPGKAKLLMNYDGSPIMHAPLSEFWQSLNYNIRTGQTNYDTYTILSDNTVSPPTHQFLFFPSTGSSSVTLYYHRVLKDLTGGGDYTAFPKDFDDVIVDMAEAEESRIYDSTDTWQILTARVQDQIKLLEDGYKNMTSEPAMQSESASKIQEATNLGRA